MKNIFKYAFALPAAVAMLSACNTDKIDYPDRLFPTDGVPAVHFVRYADRDIAIEQASMEEVICLVGDNLTSVHDLYFNDQPAILNSSYMTAHTLVVAVPKTQAKVETDKIYLITRDSSVVAHPFKVLPPAPKLSGMSLEWARPGESVTIYGRYLFAPLTVSFPGADDITLESNPSGDYVTVTVPEGAQPGKIKVTTVSGTAQSVFQYRDSRGMLFDFDGMTGLDNHGWNGHAATADDGTGISGNFFQFGDGSAELKEAATWDETNFSLVYWPGSWNDPENYEGAPRLTDFADFSDWKNMALKFEMFIPSANPWSQCAMQICFAGVDKVSYGNTTVDIYGKNVAGANNVYMSGDECPRALYRPWQASGSYDTGDKWITVTIPFSEFVYGWSGGIATGSLSADSFTSLWMFVSNGGVEGTPCAPIIKVDNIRAVPII